MPRICEKWVLYPQYKIEGIVNFSILVSACWSTTSYTVVNRILKFINCLLLTSS